MSADATYAPMWDALNDLRARFIQQCVALQESLRDLRFQSDRAGQIANDSALEVAVVRNRVADVEAAHVASVSDLHSRVSQLQAVVACCVILLLQILRIVCEKL